MTGTQTTARRLIQIQVALAVIATITVLTVILVGALGIGPFGHGSLPAR